MPLKSQLNSWTFSSTEKHLHDQNIVCFSNSMVYVSKQNFKFTPYLYKIVDIYINENLVLERLTVRLQILSVENSKIN